MDSVANGRQNLSARSLLQRSVCLGDESVPGYSSTWLGAIRPSSQAPLKRCTITGNYSLEPMLKHSHLLTFLTAMSARPALFHCVGEDTWEEFIPHL